MKSAALKRFTPLIGVGLFVLAAVVLYRQLKAYHLRDILAQAHTIPSGRILTALPLMAGSYLVMTGYDLLALRHIRYPLPPAKTALTAFLGNAFSNNIGFSMIAGASVRYRLYMGALVVCRGIYYLLPLLIATAALGVVEARRQRTVLTRLQTLAGGAMEALFIPLLSLSVFVGGAILMFSGALPAIPHRLGYLKDMLPLLFLELSHFLGSLAGMGLLLLARGLRGYKEKFNPLWRPRYLAVPGGLSLPRTLADIGALISGGLKGILFK